MLLNILFSPPPGILLYLQRNKTKQKGLPIMCDVKKKNLASAPFSFLLFDLDGEALCNLVLSNSLSKNFLGAWLRIHAWLVERAAARRGAADVGAGGLLTMPDGPAAAVVVGIVVGTVSIGAASARRFKESFPSLSRGLLAAL